MLSLKWQRGIFLFVAIALILGSCSLPRLGGDVEIIVAAALILFLGVPHGALDVLYLRKVLQVRSAPKIAALLLLYLTVSAGVVLLWLISPLIFLVGFLIASGFHFSGDPEDGAHPITRVAVGAGVVVLPSLLYKSELTHLYSLLTNATVAESVVAISVPLALVVICLSAVAITFDLFRKRHQAALELIVIVLLATLVAPLLAFTIYFCLMHGARHILRTGELVGISRKAFVLECALPMAGVFILAGVAWAFRTNLSLDASIIKIVFVMLAALTAPHMLIVEPVRLGGWRMPSPKSLKCDENK